MNEDKLVSQKYIELDIIFFIIRYNDSLTEILLFEKLQQDFPLLNINKMSVEVLLNKLVNDKHVVIDDQGKLLINPVSKTFPGYTIQEMNDKRLDTIKSKKEHYYKIIPIILTSISILSTIYFGINNLKISQENSVLNKANTSKDSIIKDLKAQVDLIKRIPVK